MISSSAVHLPRISSHASKNHNYALMCTQRPFMCTRTYAEHNSLLLTYTLDDAYITIIYYTPTSPYPILYPYYSLPYTIPLVLPTLYYTPTTSYTILYPYNSLPYSIPLLLPTLFYTPTTPYIYNKYIIIIIIIINANIYNTCNENI